LVFAKTGGVVNAFTTPPVVPLIFTKVQNIFHFLPKNNEITPFFIDKNKTTVE